MLIPLTTALLLLGPASSPEPADAAPTPAVESPEFDATLQRLRDADDYANREPVAATEELREAIDALSEFGPGLAADEDARRQRMMARLNLARAYGIAGKPDEAAEVMDNAIRDAIGGEIAVPADDFGPTLGTLYRERLAALEDMGTATLEIDCQLACEIYVNEVQVEPTPPPLLLGSYRVWIESPDAKRPPVRVTVDFTEADQTETIVFGPLNKKAEPAPVAPKQSQLMPRWAEITLVVLGTGLTTAGVVVGATANGNPGRLGAGIAMSVIGGTSLITGVVTLSIDERRLANGEIDRHAMLNWTMRF